MALHYIVDGYNIIKSDDTGTFSRGSLEEQRGRLIALIREHRPQGSENNAVTVVFDGVTGHLYAPSMPSAYSSGSVRIVFSEGCSADERIVDMASAGRRGETVVVTDDKGIRRHLGGFGVRFMTSADFRRRLTVSGHGGRHRYGGKADEKPVSPDVDDELWKHWLK